MAGNPDPRRVDLYAQAVRGEMWSPPEEEPEIPVVWIRDLLVTGLADGKPVHAKGVQIRVAVLDGELDLQDATLKVPLRLDNIDTEHPINLTRADGATVTITGSRLTDLNAAELRLDHTLDLSGSTVDCGVTLAGVTLGGDLACTGAAFTNPDGNALFADRMQVTGSVFLRGEFEANGQVRLGGATIGGDLDCGEATFTNPDGNALFADRMQVTGHVFLSDGFEANGAVRLLGATIGGNLSCVGATFTNPDGDALHGQGLNVDGGLVWFNLVKVEGAVSLLAAQVGVLADDEPSWQFPDMTYRLQGLRVDRFAGIGADWDAEQRTEWIKRAEDAGPGIYEMVAAWYRSVGRDGDARHIGIAKQQARSSEFSWWRRPLHWLWGFFAGYGYQSWRAAVGLVVAYAIGVGVFSSADMILARRPEVYAFNPLIYSADVVVPLIDLKQATQWAPAHTWPGLVTMWSLIAAGWLLSIALVAAVSGLYTKD